MIALREAARAGVLAPAHWLRNIGAGIVVGVVALPLAMAFAIASGAKPEQGLYTAIVAALAVSAFGGSRVQIAGPTGAFVVVLASVTATHGIDGLQIATLMAGVILLAMGYGRLGALIRFIPEPVIAGFTAGIGVVIWVGQWKDFFGLPQPEGAHFHEKLWSLVGSLPRLDGPTTGLALTSLAILLVSPRLPGVRRVPAPLLALIAAAGAQAFFHFDSVATIGTAFGGIPSGIPMPRLPEVSADRLLALLGPAFTIAMLGAIESLLSAVVADGMAGTRHDSNQELIGQGIANIAAPLVGGFAATGAIARTATNVRNGGNSPLAGIVHSATLVLVIVLAAPLAASVPLAVLSAILFVVAWNMSDAGRFVLIVRRAPRADVVVLVATFALTVFADLVIAVNVGVALAVLHFLRRMSTSVQVAPSSAGALEAALGTGSLPPGVLAYDVHGPLFFGAVGTFERALESIQGIPRALIFRLDSVPFIDMTALLALEDAVRRLHRRDVRVLISGANRRVRGKLERAGIIELLGAANACADMREAVNRAGA
jgi:sulfate permease, SulP family